MRIFVGSTFEDLRLHRAAAIGALRQLGHDVVAMEDFTAATLPPVEVVMDRVADCDAYLGLFAWRYGYVPEPGAAIPEGVLPAGAEPDRTSITHMEYLRAKELKLPIVAFLLEETAPWPPSLIDAFAGEAEPAKRPKNAPPPGKAIRDLRASLQTERVVGYFSTPDELASRVATAVANLGVSLGLETNLLELKQPVSAISDDSRMSGIREEITRASTTGQLISTIDIATKWWSTRLFLLAALAREFTQIVRIVVVERREFVGMLSTDTVLNRLEPTHPKLARFDAKLRGMRMRLPDQQVALAGAEEEWAKQLPRVKEELETTHVTRANLRTWFGDAMLVDAIEAGKLEEASLLDIVRILSYPNDFVPVHAAKADGDRRRPARAEGGTRSWKGAPVVVIDKRALNDHLAQRYLGEMVDRARLR